MVPFSYMCVCTPQSHIMTTRVVLKLVTYFMGSEVLDNVYTYYCGDIILIQVYIYTESLCTQHTYSVYRRET